MAVNLGATRQTSIKALGRTEELELWLEKHVGSEPMVAETSGQVEGQMSRAVRA